METAITRALSELNVQFRHVLIIIQVQRKLADLTNNEIEIIKLLKLEEKLRIIQKEIKELNSFL